jgi:hypothetical protein
MRWKKQNIFILKMIMNVLYAMIFLMKVSNVEDVLFYVVPNVLIIIFLLIIITVLFVDIEYF